MRTCWQTPFGTAALLALAWAATATAQPEPRDAAADFDQPGLALVLRSSDSAETDARSARLLALYVPEGQSASPFLDAGPFEATFRGAIELDLNDSYRFRVRGSGSVRLSIGGEVVIERQELPAGDAPLSTDGEVRLNKGLNPIELVYRSPAAGDASLRVTWGNDYLPEEPLSPASLRHADTPALRQGSARRAGRDLVAGAMCVRCHAAAEPSSAPANGMPEAAESGPDLDGIGSRRRRPWLEQWLLDPKALQPKARMPRVLSTDAAEARQQAADLAAYLAAADGGTATTETAASLPTGEVADGGRLYAEIGCAACHGGPTTPPGMDAAPRLVPSPESDTATPASGPPGATASPTASTKDVDRILRLRDKWRPSALAAYLLDPAGFDPWSRMPRTALEPPDAASLAAYLLTPAPAGGAAPTDPLPETAPGALQGDAERGRRLADELRCRSCHSLPGGDAPPPAAPANELAGRATIWAAGGDRTPNHPRYDMDSPQIGTIERFLTEDVTSLAVGVPGEFAERRIRSGGCLSCHGRDGIPAAWSPPSGNTLPSPAEGTAPDDFAASADDETGPDLLPPDLTWAGEKLRSDWLADFLSGRTTDRPRPHLRVRMPAFASHSDILAAGLHHQHGLPASPPDDEPVDSELATIGRDLIRGDRLGCHSCHALGADPALGGEGSEETINFDLVRHRLRRPWFDWFLRDPQRILPGTKMPQFVDEDGYTALYDVFDGEATRQFEAIWHYLGTLD